MIGFYVAGDSAVHRARPGLKVALLLALTTVLVVVRTWEVVTGAAVLVALVGLWAGLGLRGLGRLVWPLRWIVLVLTPVQAWLTGWERAYVIVGGLVVAIGAAALVSATTRVADMTDAIMTVLRPLGRLGLDVERVGLVIALSIRSVPVLLDALRTVREARAARGMRLTPDTLLTPLVIRAVRHADRVGDALAARGVDD
ncbi:biotin transport system permease protein [Kineosphaera limosa]|uniref:Putative ABC transporter permease protein n=1 Tax=Kineosphaera limosa NBRC 100340 TaxID=1184609 RepID=K6W4S8_9MICO|nr:energy-coupling factor transporter transmembrane component T [Kineosphaera limosa]NYE02310.1 biotin transport system permease protein [Kineosphaera limosa]GAB94165.1 putative ABC transporter permease protein [Kineosphaera limosa NBRC 100340]